MGKYGVDMTLENSPLKRIHLDATIREQRG